MEKHIDKEMFMKQLFDGMHIMVGGFMTCGTPETLIDWVLESHVKELVIICNDAGYEDQGVGKLIKANRVKKLMASHIGLNPYVGKLMSEGKLEVELIPQGTMAERIRAHGAGLGGILTPTGFKTIVEENKKVIEVSGKKFVLEEALGADLSLILAHQADPLGNLTYDKTARNFNPVMAMASKKVVVEVAHFVDVLDPEIIVTPHIFIDYIVKGGY